MEKLIRKYRNKDVYNLNCSESIVYAANEFYNLSLNDNALKMMTGFGGGVCEKELCGVISGSVSVLGMVLKGKSNEEGSVVKQSVIDFKNEFKNMYNKLDCEYLVDNFKDDVVGCDKIIFDSVDLLQKVISKYM